MKSADSDRDLTGGAGADVVRVSALIGDSSDSRFEGRRRVGVPVAWDEAGRRRLRRVAEDGTDVAIDLRQPTFLADGAVLDDDGARLLVVARTSEPALVIRFDLDIPPARIVAHGLALGHAFGNQHVPIDIDGADVRVPLTTNEGIARATVESLELEGVSVELASVALARSRPLPIGHGHAHKH